MADSVDGRYGQYMSAAERETIVNANDGEPTAYVYSAQRAVINKLKKHPCARLIEEGMFGTSVWARFEIRAEFVNFRLPRKKRELTDEQRADFGERMKLVRANRADPGDATPADAMDAL